MKLRFLIRCTKKYYSIKIFSFFFNVYIRNVIFNSNKPDKQSDETLLKLFQKEKDLEILGQLFSRYTHLVYGVCLKYFKNREDSQDGVIQIFELLVEQLPKHSVLNFKSWLHSVTRNFCLMQLRKSKASKNQLEKYSNDFFMENEETMHPIDTEAKNEINNALQLCLEKLKELQKKCVSLFYYEEKCYREISEELHLEEKKVKSYIQNGKRNLKICIEKQTNDEA